MTRHVQDVTEMRSSFTKAAYTKYGQAKDVVESLTKQVKDDQHTLERAQSELRVGIEEWKTDTKFDAAMKIIGAVMEFSLAIGSVCAGMPSTAPVTAAIETVKEVEKVAGEGKKIVGDVLKAVSDCVDAIKNLYSTIETAVQSLQSLQGDLEADVNKIHDVVGGDADATGIISIAAWDRWILDSEAQLDVAIELREKWETDSRHDEEVEAKFYDRFMTIRTSVVVAMRNLVWAYKYEALEDSKVVLSVQKSAAIYQQDLSMISVEFDEFLKDHNPGFTELHRTMGAKKLPYPFGSQIIESLKTKHSATFTFAPQTSKPPHDESVAGPFKDGEHFRVIGLHAYLVGATSKRPEESSDPQFKLTISISGIYADLRDDKIFQFCTQPLTRIPFNYNIEGTKYVIQDETHFESKNFAAPTPFTQWTIAIKNPEEIDLEKLTDVRLEWAGKYYSLK